MTSKRKTKPGTFVYQKWRQEQFLRLLRESKFDDDVLGAYRGDTGPLCDYLKNSDLPLDYEHRKKLAELIYWHSAQAAWSTPWFCPRPQSRAGGRTTYSLRSTAVEIAHVRQQACAQGRAECTYQPSV